MRPLEFYYFTDPMCSWCYGFGPEVEQVVREYSDRYPVQVVLGGLRPDESRPLGARMAREIAHHWEMVEKASGQKFDYGFFERHPDFVYNTAPASRAVVAAGMVPEGHALRFQHELQRLFYAEGQDPTDLAVLERAAAGVGMDVSAFRAAFDQPETETVLRANFEFSRSLGVGGFPTLTLRCGTDAENSDTRFYLICQGYAPFAEIKERVARLTERLAQEEG